MRAKSLPTLFVEMPFLPTFMAIHEPLPIPIGTFPRHMPLLMTAKAFNLIESYPTPQRTFFAVFGQMPPLPTIITLLSGC